jgi:hypothetical protein
MVPQAPNCWIALTTVGHQGYLAAQGFKKACLQMSGHVQVDSVVGARNTSNREKGPTAPSHAAPHGAMTRECDYFLKPMFAWTVWPVVGIVTQIVTPQDGSLVVFFELSCSTY